MSSYNGVYSIKFNILLIKRLSDICPKKCTHATNIIKFKSTKRDYY